MKSSTSFAGWEKTVCDRCGLPIVKSREGGMWGFPDKARHLPGTCPESRGEEA